MVFHQSGQIWCFEQDSILVNLEFEKFHYVACAYKDFTILFVYVNDTMVWKVHGPFMVQGKTPPQAKKCSLYAESAFRFKNFGKNSNF